MNNKLLFGLMISVVFVFFSAMVFAESPRYTTEVLSVSNATEYAPGSTYGFQINWTNITQPITDVLFESNFNGTLVNYTNTTPSGGPNVKNDTDSYNTGTYYINFTDLAVSGSYQYKWYSTNGTHENATDTIVYAVDQNETNPVTLTITLGNGSAYTNQNITVSYGSVTSAVSATYSNSGNVSLLRNGSYISGASETVTLNPAIYNYTFNITGTTNYTSNTSGLTYYMIVTGLGAGSGCGAAAQCASGYCVNSYCRNAAYYCGDSVCDAGESCGSCSFDCGICSSGEVSDPYTVAKGTENGITVTILSFDDVRANGAQTIVISADQGRDEHGVKEISFVATNLIYDETLKIKKLDGKPADTTDVPETVSHYLEFIPTGTVSDRTDEITVKFTVSKTWITDNDIDPDNVALYRFTDDWEKLVTSKISEGDTEIEYSAELPGFSYFAIAGSEVVEGETEEPGITIFPTGEDGMGSLEYAVIIIVLIIVGASLYYVYKFLKDPFF